MSKRVSRHLIWIALLGCIVIIERAGAEERSAEAHAELRQFYPTGEFDLVIDKQRVAAQILFSRRAAAYLITLPGDKHHFLLSQRTKKVSRIAAEPLRRKSGDTDLTANVAPEVVGAFRMEKADILIEATGLTGRLTPRAPALGRLSGSELFAHSPQYGLIQRAYQPKDDAAKFLQRAADVKVEVVFGSWCPRCQQSLGNALAVEAALATQGPGFTYYGLPSPPAAWKDARFVEVKSVVKALPTALVYVKDRLVGHIPPADWKRFEVTLADVLRKHIK